MTRSKWLLVGCIWMCSLIAAACSDSAVPYPHLLAKEEGTLHILYVGYREEDGKFSTPEAVRGFGDRLPTMIMDVTGDEDSDYALLDIRETPIFIVFDTQGEVFRSSNEIEVKHYLEKVLGPASADHVSHVTNDSIAFLSERSFASLVEAEDRLLSVEFAVFNRSNSAVGPFTIEIKVYDKELKEWLESNFEHMGMTFTLQPDERHGFGGNALVRRDITAEQLRAVLEDSKSLKVELVDPSGEVIASEWIQRLQVIR